MVYSFLSHEMQTDAPDELLDQIILSEKQIPFEGQLNNPYRDALKQLFRDDKEQNQLRQVFGGITILQRLLPLRDFARLGMECPITIPSPASQCFHSSLLNSQ